MSFEVGRGEVFGLLGLDVLADVELAAGDPGRAVRFIGAADRIRADAGLPLRGDDASLAAARLERARTLIGSDVDEALAIARGSAVEPVLAEVLLDKTTSPPV